MAHTPVLIFVIRSSILYSGFEYRSCDAALPQFLKSLHQPAPIAQSRCVASVHVLTSLCDALSYMHQAGVFSQYACLGPSNSETTHLVSHNGGGCESGVYVVGHVVLSFPIRDSEAVGYSSRLIPKCIKSKVLTSQTTVSYVRNRR